MLYIDLSQTLRAGLHAQIGKQHQNAVDENLIRHMCLNTIRATVKANKVYSKSGVVICCDDRKYWRKEFFPFYKAKRASQREATGLNWSIIYTILNRIRDEIRENLPYKVMMVDNAEADDIIGTLVPRYSQVEKTMIVSGDGDFLQLQKYPGVEQYSPMLKKKVTSENAHYDLRVKIIRGDKNDGIPNILSAPDAFINENSRQQAITEKKLKLLLNKDPSVWSELAQTGYSRNETLIDLSKTPVHIQQNIINTFDTVKPAPKNKMLNYFIEKKLMNLIDVVEDF